jgi:hypothetical protein
MPIEIFVFLIATKIISVVVACIIFCISNFDDNLTAEGTRKGMILFSGIFVALTLSQAIVIGTTCTISDTSATQSDTSGTSEKPAGSLQENSESKVD